VEAALEADDLAAAEATGDLIADLSTRDGLLPSFIRAHLRAGNHAAATTAAQHVPDADIPRRLSPRSFSRLWMKVPLIPPPL
jgi:hypothetical protein